MHPLLSRCMQHNYVASFVRVLLCAQMLHGFDCMDAHSVSSGMNLSRVKGEMCMCQT